MKTAAEILYEKFNEAKNKYPNENWVDDILSVPIENGFVIEAMKEYAKGVAQSALTRASENSVMVYHDGYTKENRPLRHFQSGTDNLQVDKSTIINTEIITP